MTEPAMETLSRNSAAPPHTRRDDIVEVMHGVEVSDPYRWLEASDDQAVEQWQDRQDRFARSLLDSLPSVDTFAAQLRPLLSATAVTTPMERGDSMFFSKRTAEQEKPSHFMQIRGGSEPVLLFEPNQFAERDVSVDLLGPSRDGRFAAYAFREKNKAEFTLRIYDVAARRVLPGEDMPGMWNKNLTWSATEDGFFYVWLPEEVGLTFGQRLARATVRYHRLGTDRTEDSIVWAKPGGDTQWLHLGVSPDGGLYVLTVFRGYTESDIYVKRADDPEAGFSKIVARTGYYYDAIAGNGMVYMLTNDGAPRYRIVAVRPDAVGRRQWLEVVPEPKDGVIETFRLVGAGLAVKTSRRACSEIEIYDRLGGFQGRVETPPMGTISDITANPDGDRIYFAYESFSIPPRIYRVSMEDLRKPHVFHETDIDIEPTDYQTKQVHYPSKDGTMVSMFLFGRKEAFGQKRLPTLMFGYGGFNLPITPEFDARTIVWVDNGGLYAVPNLRGGGEYGSEWHRQGMLENKQNVFDDFIAAAEWLIEQGYTTPERLTIRGRSNGGLLVGAVVTQRPELFGGVLCGVPLIDMVRYDKFGYAQGWVPEYGDPDRPDDFSWLYAYSPYHNVKEGTKYPPILMLMTTDDDLVHPGHVRKLVAALQWAHQGENPILLRVQRDAGHAGTGRVSSKVGKIAHELAFLADSLAMQQAD
jgi:prolyl oligopeptidase